MVTQHPSTFIRSAFFQVSASTEARLYALASHGQIRLVDSEGVTAYQHDRRAGHWKQGFQTDARSAWVWLTMGRGDLMRKLAAHIEKLSPMELIRAEYFGTLDGELVSGPLVDVIDDLRLWVRFGQIRVDGALDGDLP